MSDVSRILSQIESGDPAAVEQLLLRFPGVDRFQDIDSKMMRSTPIRFARSSFVPWVAGEYLDDADGADNLSHPFRVCPAHLAEP